MSSAANGSTRPQLRVLQGGKPQDAPSRRILEPGPFLDGGRKPTPYRVYKLLRAALESGARLELDWTTDAGHRTLMVTDVVAAGRSLTREGFRLIGQDGLEILHLVYPPYFINWYLPLQRSRDQWARIRFHEAIKSPGKRSWLRTNWIRFSAGGSPSPGDTCCEPKAQE